MRFSNFKRETGQAIVEAAFTLPILLLVCCAIIDFGWVLTNQLMLHNCSREAARLAVVNPEKTEIEMQALVEQKARQVVFVGDPLDVTAVADFTAPPDIKVTVTKNLELLTPVAGIFFDNPLLIQSSSTMWIGE